jgi:hypothetical protein
MYTLQAHMQCYDRFFEVFSNEIEYTELIIENAVSQLLLDFFDEVKVDDVTIIFSPNLYMGLQHCSIQIQAQCFCQTSELLPRTKDNMELVVENSMCSLLRELFGSVAVDCVTFNPSPWNFEYDHSIASSV